jgi:hypothetical protein
VEKALLILPEILDFSRSGIHGLIDVNKMKKVFKDRLGIELPHNMSYYVRGELLGRLKANDSALLKKLRVEKGGNQ